MVNRLDDIEARLKAATPGRLRVAIMHPEADPVELFRSHLVYGSGNVYAVIALDHPQHVGPDDRPDHAVTVAITGNGPTSEANADFIAHALAADLAALLAMARAVEDYWECDQRSGLPKGVSVKEYQAKRAALFAALEPLLEGE